MNIRHTSSSSVSWARAVILPLLAVVVGGAAASPVAAALPDPWRWVGAFPSGANLKAVWAAAADDVFVGGTGGSIMRWDGSAWTVMETPTQKTIYDIHGTSGADVWAVGGDEHADDPLERCVILHFDGSAWTETNPPTWGGWTVTLGAVHAVAANDVWAVPVSSTLAAHWNGSAWLLDVPVATAEGRFLDVTATGGGDVYIVGSHGQILHRNGGVWVTERKTETGPVSVDLVTSVWAYDAAHVWAGNNAMDMLQRGTGGTWSIVDLDATCQISSIWGRSASEVYLVGSRCVRLFDGVDIQQLWDYSAESREPWARAHGASDRLFAVGSGGVAHELVIASGGQLAQTSIAVGIGDAPVTRALTGMTPYGASLVLAWGNAEIVVLDEGGETTFHTRPPGGDASSVVDDVLSPQPDDVYMSWFDTTEPYDGGGNHHWDGTAWAPILNQYGGTFYPAVMFWSSPAGSVYCLGWNVLSRITGGTLVTEVASLPPGSVVFTAMEGSSDTEILLGTSDGRVYLYDGGSLTQDATPASGAVRFMARFEDDFYAVGDNGLAWWRDTASGMWSQMNAVALASGETFSGLAAGADGVYATQRTPGGVAGGSLGRIWRFVDGAAEIVVSGLAGMPEGLVATHDGFLYAALPSRWASGVTNRPRPASFAVQRLSGAANAWQPIGATGVSLLADVSGWQPVIVAFVSEGELRDEDLLAQIYGVDWLGIPYSQLLTEVPLFVDGSWGSSADPAWGGWHGSPPGPPPAPPPLPVGVTVGITVDLATGLGPDGVRQPTPKAMVDFFETAQIMARSECDDMVEWTPVATVRSGDPSVDTTVQFITAAPQSHLSVWTVGTSLVFRDGFESGNTSAWSAAAK